MAKYYYAVSLSQITATTSDTDQLQLLTTANQRAAKVTGIFGSGTNVTVGGISIFFGRYGTASSGGSAATPRKRDQLGPAAGTAANTLPTPGSTFTRQGDASVGQAGGGRPWLAIEDDAGISLEPNAGANGNLDIHTLAASATMLMDMTAEFFES